MLTLLLSLVMTLLTVWVGVLVFYLLFLAAVYYTKDERPPYYYPPEKRFAIMVPAHNEGAHLCGTIESLKSCHYPQDLFEIFVIADNCSDNTSEVAVNYGANCLIRREPTLPGKSHALRWGLDRIDLDRFDAVAIIDADTIVKKDFLEVLNDHLCAGRCALQVRYRIVGEENTPFGVLQTLGNTAENLLFYGGRRKLGLSSFLRGNGMAFSAELLRRLPLAARSTTEDLEYTAELLTSGERIEFAAETEVVARTPPNLRSSLSQRTRWASGTLGVMLRYIPRFIRSSIRQGGLQSLEPVLGFLTLSRPSLLYLSLILLTCSLFLRPPRLSLTLSILNMLWLILLVFYFLLAIPFEKQKKKALRSFLTAPLFGCYLAAVQLLALVGFNRGKWVRTARR